MAGNSVRVLGLVTLNVVLSVFGTGINSTVVFVISKNKELRKGLNLFILSLALPDLLSNILAQPIYIYLLLNGEKSDLTTLKKFFQFFAFVSLHVSTNNLVAITLYRLRALSRFFRHIILISRNQAWFVLVIVWVAGGVSAVVFNTEPGKAAAKYLHVIVIVAWICSYAGIFWLVRKDKHQIAAKKDFPTTPALMASIKYESEAAKTAAILVGSSLICFVPDVVFEFLGNVDHIRLSWGYTVLFASAVINPCIFVWRSQQFKTALRKTVRCL